MLRGRRYAPFFWRNTWAKFPPLLAEVKRETVLLSGVQPFNDIPIAD